jgi:hypothetical protein
MKNRGYEWRGMDLFADLKLNDGEGGTTFHSCSESKLGRQEMFQAARDKILAHLPWMVETASNAGS